MRPSMSTLVSTMTGWPSSGGRPSSMPASLVLGPRPNTTARASRRRVPVRTPDVHEGGGGAQRDHHAEPPRQRVEQDGEQRGDQQRGDQSDQAADDLARGRLVKRSLEPQVWIDAQQRSGERQRRGSGGSGREQGRAGDRGALGEHALGVRENEDPIQHSEDEPEPRADHPRERVRARRIVRSACACIAID